MSVYRPPSRNIQKALDALTRIAGHINRDKEEWNIIGDLKLDYSDPNILRKHKVKLFEKSNTVK